MTRRDAMKLLGTTVAVTTATTGSAPAAAADKDKPGEVWMVVYPKFTALDLVGPHHVFSLLERYKVRLVWKDTKEVVSDTGIPVRPTTAFADCPGDPAVLFVPGGTEGTLAAMEDKEVREFLAGRGARAKFVTSVCTGSLVLGAAGLLKGYKATTHWLTLDTLKQFGAEPVAARVVEDRNRVTGAGVTAGIDFALALAAKLKDESYAKAVQLMMEYDPQPPFKSGNPKVADADTVKMLRAMTAPFQTKLDAAIQRLPK
ncbi:DJ-1/PfpI family protein [Frigoriglobus tundricola]|uniref:ThiJ/PfpI family protein n=1 Tax=Frigoriglobus tundricola TaxID=2774151 RepID=A0A6M5YII6_9BACT|nr:DJ-1/PfpI family protein [Frigoriglobus tundricola]QJW93131.1 ThiJ/PfpI family protein [Frigoriglobus tundricola]